MTQGSLLAQATPVTRRPVSLCDRLAEFFKAHPGEWLGARELEFAGRQAWRTRVSELRKAPYFMRIENRVRVVRYSGPLEPGRSRHFKVSEYCYVETAENADTINGARELYEQPERSSPPARAIGGRATG